MQTANILLALGGDPGNSVPKYGVTPAEIAVLRLIHGDESVTEVEPTGTIERKSREERSRLAELYGRQVDGRFVSPHVDALFPGVAARVFEDLDELDLPEEFYKAETRVTAKSKPKKQAEPAPEPEPGLDALTVKELQALAEKEQIDLGGATKKADIIAAIEKAHDERKQDGDADGEDGIDDMPDENLFG